MSKKGHESTEFSQEFGIYYSVQQLDAQAKDMPKQHKKAKKAKRDKKNRN